MEHGQIVEYRDAPADRFSKVTRLDVANVGRREYRLSHHSVGFECAGSCARYNGHEVWSVLFETDGATHGRRFLTLTDARGMFDKWGMRDAA